jgi:hypothetical protein
MTGGLAFVLLSCVSLAAACAAPRAQSGRASTAPAAISSVQQPPGEQRPPSAAAARRRPNFEALMIDDSADRFVVPAGSELPEGVTLEEEHITWGTQASHPRYHFVHLLPRPGEDLAHALASIDAWLRGFELPADARLGWQEIRRLDETSGKQVSDGWRSLVLRGPVLITDADFLSVSAQPGYGGGSELVIVLSPDATERFRIATRDHVQQRIALVVEGLVSAAPIIISEIPGGKLHLLLDDSKDVAEVVRLVKLLTPSARAATP